MNDEAPQLSVSEIARAYRAWIDVEQSFGLELPLAPNWPQPLAPNKQKGPAPAGGPPPRGRAAPQPGPQRGPGPQEGHDSRAPSQVPERPMPSAAPAPAPRPASGGSVSGGAPPPPAVVLRSPEERSRREALLEPSRQEAAACSKCRLCEERTQAVFGVGDPCARLMFVGEGPGFDEDRLGEPFVGRAGQLLDKIIAAMSLRREDVYIANIVKCRPPGNRNPEAEEIASCLPYLEKQIGIIQPDVICCLGSIAARSLLKSEDSVGRMRGSFHRYAGIPTRVTYHPAYLLRNPAEKRKAWEDVQAIMNLLGLKAN